MPKRLPVKDIVSGLLNSVSKGVRFWLHYTLVAFAWLGVVPLTACKFMENFFIFIFKFSFEINILNILNSYFNCLLFV